MHLKAIRIKNFRKFENDDSIEFVNTKDVNNISEITTLIIGKNNVGKTTIITFLEKLINGKFVASDFNFKYLIQLLEEYKNSKIEKYPIIESSFLLALDNENATISAIADFLPISEDVEEIEIKVKYSLVEDSEFKKNLEKNILSEDNEYNQFYKFLDLINNARFKLEYFRKDNTKVENFKIKNLIELQVVSANKPLENNTLSNAFKKIIQFRYENESKDVIENSIKDINKTITEDIAKPHIKIVNNAFGAIRNNKKYGIHLNGNLSFDNIFQNLIRYEYVENKIHIPENQFGLGYKNLMIIISKIIDFIQKNPDDEQSQINLIFIEEPENYMHPQMQEKFIKYINESIESILKDTNKQINSQLIIITHSSHIINSKIHYARSFDNIIYLYENKNDLLQIINLKDNNISTEKDSLKFLKKHIKFEVSNIFFSDAVIVAEGLTEEIILKYFLEKYELSNYYISIFKIDGTHAFKYNELFKLLNIPILVITDLDIKRKQDNNDNISDLRDRITSNATLKYYYGVDNTFNNYGMGLVQSKNIYITTQIEQINNYYATSFEEAFILTNLNNRILIETLKQIKPTKYKEFLSDNNSIDASKSYQIQKMLSNEKGNFAITLLEKMANEERHNLKLPKYIEDGLNWLLCELQG